MARHGLVKKPSVPYENFNKVQSTSCRQLLKKAGWQEFFSFAEPRFIRCLAR